MQWCTTRRRSCAHWPTVRPQGRSDPEGAAAVSRGAVGVSPRARVPRPRGVGSEPACVEVQKGGPGSILPFFAVRLRHGSGSYICRDQSCTIRMGSKQASSPVAGSERQPVPGCAANTPWRLPVRRASGLERSLCPERARRVRSGHRCSRTALSCSRRKGTRRSRRATR